MRVRVDGAISSDSSGRSSESERGVAAILFDRDGTLVVNVPHNADPAKVIPMPTARDAIDCIRRAGVPMAVVSNQSVIARGMATRGDVDRTNERVEELLGPIGPFFVCPHGLEGGCVCRKPQPGLLLQAASHLGVEIDCVVMIGDTGTDMRAAAAAGARGILVPTTETSAADIATATEMAPTLLAAVEMLLT